MTAEWDSDYLEYLKNYHLKDEFLGVRVEIALLGLGRIGMLHLVNVLNSPYFKVKCIMDADTKRMGEIAQKFHLEDVIQASPDTIETVLKDPKIEAVIICTPTYTHQAMVLTAIKAGKAVFCEKPISSKYEDIQKCYREAEKARVALYCAFNRRFDPALQCLKKKIQRNEIGQLQVVKTCSRDNPVPSVDYLKISGGIFHDCAVHDIDVICWLFEEVPVSVVAQANCFRQDIKELDDFDTVAIILKFPSGGLGIIDLSRSAEYGYDQRVEAFGSKGMLRSEEQRPIAIQHHTKVGSTAVPIYYSFPSRYKASYISELNYFLTQIKKGLSSNYQEVKCSEVLAVMKIAEACEKSVRDNNQGTSIEWESMSDAYKNER